MRSADAETTDCRSKRAKRAVVRFMAAGAMLFGDQFRIARTPSPNKRASRDNRPQSAKMCRVRILESTAHSDGRKVLACSAMRHDTKADETDQQHRPG
jgi:hypothetical protein